MTVVRRDALEPGADSGCVPCAPPSAGSADQPVLAPGRFGARWAHLRRWFTQLTQLGWPRRFPVVQFPNVPLLVAIVAGRATGIVNEPAGSYSQSVSYLAMTVWAYEELVHGVNWFRRLLGLVYLIVMVMRVAHAAHA
jgi:hypothetical protein